MSIFKKIFGANIKQTSKRGIVITGKKAYGFIKKQSLLRKHLQKKYSDDADDQEFEPTTDGQNDDEGENLNLMPEVATSFYDPIGKKVALITGGATGIGFHYARVLLKSGAEAIMIADLDEYVGREAIAELANQFGSGKAAFIRTDVSIPEQLENAFERTIETWGGLHLVINNAAILNEKKWEQEINVNCTGLARSTLLALDYMGKDNGGEGGSVVNISSILAFEKPAACPLHVATKYFAIGLSCSLGKQANFERTGVKVLTLCPGITMSNMILNLEQKAKDYEQGHLLRQEIEELPVQPPEDVAESLIRVLRKGTPGSVWICEAENMVYEVKPKTKKNDFTLSL